MNEVTKTNTQLTDAGSIAVAATRVWHRQEAIVAAHGAVTAHDIVGKIAR